MAAVKDIERIAEGRGLIVKTTVQYGDYRRMWLEDHAGKIVFRAGLISDFGQAMDALDRWQAQLEIAEEPVKKVQKTQVRKDAEYGKSYRTKDNVIFKVHNPEKLTKKQKQVVYRFMQRIDGILGNMPGRAYEDFAPWIDLIFQLQRHEITQAQFERITKIELGISTWDSLHDHNL